MSPDITDEDLEARMREDIRNRIENGYPIEPTDSVADIAKDWQECTDGCYLPPERVKRIMVRALLAEGFDLEISL